MGGAGIDRERQSVHRWRDLGRRVADADSFRDGPDRGRHVGGQDDVVTLAAGHECELESHFGSTSWRLRLRS